MAILYPHDREINSRVRSVWSVPIRPADHENLKYWVATDRKTPLRVMRLIEDVLHDLFTGFLRPEPLKYLAPDTWSRRITQEHRLVYLVGDPRVDFLPARHHY